MRFKAIAIAVVLFAIVLGVVFGWDLLNRRTVSDYQRGYAAGVSDVQHGREVARESGTAKKLAHEAWLKLKVNLGKPPLPAKPPEGTKSPADWYKGFEAGWIAEASR
jgi:hypothetical protein